LKDVGIEAIAAVVDMIRSQIAQDPHYWFDKPHEDFVQRMRLTNPQTYGTRIQNRFAHENNLTVVPSKLDRGDVVDPAGCYWEVKTSIVSKSSRKVNFVQIRQHQKISGYHLLVVQDDHSVIHLKLTKAQMAREVRLMGSGAHGVHAPGEPASKKREMAIRFKWAPGTGVTDRWIRSYRVDPAAG
jgi:hypothetical protein